jgi:hypothetical protein
MFIEILIKNGGIMVDKHNIKKGVEIVFADGVTRTVYPLTIKQLRKFVKIIAKMNNLDDIQTLSEEDIDNMVDAASIVLEPVDKELVEDRDRLEEAVDLDSFSKLMAVAMGTTDPNA